MCVLGIPYSPSNHSCLITEGLDASQDKTLVIDFIYLVLKIALGCVCHVFNNPLKTGRILFLTHLGHFYYLGTKYGKILQRLVSYSRLKRWVEDIVSTLDWTLTFQHRSTFREASQL